MKDTFVIINTIYKNTLLLVCFAMFSSGIFAQSKSYFPNLQRIMVDSFDEDYKVYFNYDKKSFTLMNKVCYLLPKNHPVYCDSAEALSYWTLLGKYKSTPLNDSLYIVYSPGLSLDPIFTVSNPKNKFLENISCTDFYINELGTIYTAGHTNNMFNQRRKYEIKKDTIIEVQQPFYYVGLKSKTLKPITLYKEKTGKEIVAQLPKNYDVEILAAAHFTREFETHKLFLVKTEFGLIGWLRLNEYDANEQVINGLFYAGD